MSNGYVVRAISIALIISVLTTSTPAASQTTLALATEASVNFALWFEASGLAKMLQGRGTPVRVQEKQSERDARVVRLQIFPGDVTINLNEQVTFAAVAYDENDGPVGGVKIKWSARDTDRNRVGRIARHGVFDPHAPGAYVITAEGAGKRAQVNVTVLSGQRKPQLQETPILIKSVDTRSLPNESQSKNDIKKPATARTESLAKAARPTRRSDSRRQRAHAVAQPASPPVLDDGWGDSNWWSADDPGNTPGNPPGTPMDGGAGSGNFQFAAPVGEWPGRGTDAVLKLAYNSRLWNKANNQVTYDIDRGWPGPGFSLGFSKLIALGVYNGAMIVEADGTRHSFTGNVTEFSWGTSFVGKTTDGSFIDYTYTSGIGGPIVQAEAKLPNGTVITYGAPGPAAVYPTRIEDANGNFITITYVNNSGPRIQTVVDTLGRAINFHYDPNNLLTAITAPALTSGTRTLVRLQYRQISLTPGSSYSFSGLTAVVRDPNPWVVNAIYYPGTNTGYWFGDSDSYSTYGMLAKVSERRNMAFSASSLNEQGTLTSAGQISREQTYNYPLSPSAPGGSNLTDAPTYTQYTESWTRDGTVIDQAVTTYEVHQETSPRTVTVTMPNGTKSIQHSHKHPGQFDDGLVFFDETRDASNAVLQSSTAQWEPGAYNSPRPNRITSTNDLNQTIATEFSYGASYNQVIETRAYDFGGTSLLRAIRTTYQNSSSYINRHIFSLPLVVEVFASDNTTCVSRTENQYDGQPLTATPNVVQHNQASNPHAEAEGFCFWIPDWSDPDCQGGCIPELLGCDGFCPEIFHCPYNSMTDFRGNITQVTVYSNAAGPSGPITETRRYDVTGNLVKSTSTCCEETTNGYTIDTQFAYQESQTNGSATDPFKQVTTKASYDFNTGLTKSSTDANDRQTQSNYFPENLRLQITSLPSGAHTDYAYDDIAMTLTETTYLESHPTHTTISDQNIKTLNGRAQVRQEKALGAGGVFDIVDAEYDSMGRLFRHTHPYRTGQTLQWTNFAYDGLGRPTRVTAPDGSVTETYYNERDFDTTDGYTPVRPNIVSGSAPGDTTLVRDAWGRERWGRTNAQGKLIDLVEPNPSGSGSVATGGLLTSYSYNTTGQMVGITQGSQTRSFKYDSIGRLTHQRLAEATATLNDAGTYITSGTWTDVFTYDIRSNLTSHTDARGVKAVYNYNGDPLNRLQSVSWDTSGFGDTNNPIESATTVTFAYRTKDTAQHVRDVTQVSGVTTGSISSETYSFDTESRVSGRSLVVNGRPAMDTNFAYDTLNRITDITYPKRELGILGSPRKVVHHNYDLASRSSGLTVDGQSHAASAIYNAGSQLTSLSVGASGSNQVIETYSYDPQTTLLSNQKLARSSTPGSPFLDLSYDFAGANGKRTGQLTKLLNNLNHNKDRSYTYDALGRLTQAKGGPTGTLWTQTYTYDRYGNRTSVSATGVSAKASSLPNEQLALKNEVEVPDPLRTHVPRSLSDSSLNLGSRPAPANPVVPAAPQGPPVFTDDPLVPGVTAIKAIHINELRTAVNNARARAGLSAASWAETVSAGVTVKASHITEMRARLDEARAALGLSAASYTDPSLAAGIIVKAVHIQELRQRVTEALASLPITADGHTSLAYAAASNRITTAGFQYDAAGNQTRVVKVGGAVQKYKYDAANRLVTVKDINDVTISTYTYGADNQRLITDEGGVRTYYVVDGDYVIAEYQETGGSTTPTWFKSYVYLGSRLLSTFNVNGGGETVQYHHPDRLGTRVVTNAQDTTFSEQVTHPFGTPFNAESIGTPTNRRFTSYDRSPVTGLDYAVNRQYDSEQGRFTQIDPLGMKATNLDDPQSLNMYSYSGNDPVNRVDPDGLFSLKKFFKALFKIIKLIIVAAIVAILIITITQIGWWLVLKIVIAWALQNLLLTILNSIIQEIKQHGFTIGSIFRGFGKGIARFFKAGIIIYYGNYCGPTNPNQQNDLPPIDELDAACQAHDRVYQSTPEGTPDRNSRRLRADKKIFLRALGSFLGRFAAFFFFGYRSNPVRLLASMVVAITFGAYIIVRSLFLSDSPVPPVTAVSQNVGPRASFKQPTREVHRIKLLEYPELINPAPLRTDRLRLSAAN